MGDFDPDEISRSLSVEPTWSHRKGEVNDESGLTRKSATWGLACADPDQGVAQDDLIYLLWQLGSRTTILSELAAKFNGTFELYTGEGQDFWLPPDMLRKLADLHVCINMNFLDPEGRRPWEARNANQIQ